MKKIIDYLRRLDFSETEAKLYLILLRTGPLSVADLAHKADINRTATYAYIKSLLKKGVVSQTKGISSKFIAAPPAQLYSLVEQKISNVTSLKQELNPMITLLNSTYMRTKNYSKSEIYYYQGRRSVKAIYEEVLKADEIRSYFNGAEIEKVFPENFELFNKTFDRNPKVKMYELLESSTIAKEAIKVYEGRKTYFYKFLPPDIHLTSNDILIYDGKVVIINFGDTDNIDGVIINNKNYYNNSKQVFDLIWRLLPPPT